MDVTDYELSVGDMNNDELIDIFDIIHLADYLSG
jgi:hypothetical protein